jgi:hypothetical protein
MVFFSNLINIKRNTKLPLILDITKLIKVEMDIIIQTTFLVEHIYSNQTRITNIARDTQTFSRFSTIKVNS